MSGDKEAGRIDSKGESNLQNHALNNMWSKGGDMQSYKLQPQTPKMDDSILPSVTFEDKSQNATGTKTLTAGVSENVNGTVAPAKSSYPEPQYVGESAPGRYHQPTHRTHQAHAEGNYHETYSQKSPVDNARPFHAIQTFPAMRTSDGRVVPSGQIELTIQPGQYKEGADCGNLRIPPSPHRDNYYNVLLNAHYDHGKLVGTPAHVNGRGQLEAQYPQEIGIRTR